MVGSGFFTVGVLLGKGDGTLQSVVNYGSGGFGPGSVVIADLNGDRAKDLIASNCAGDTTNGCGVAFVPNQAATSLSTPTLVTLMGSVTSLPNIVDIWGGSADLSRGAHRTTKGLPARQAVQDDAAIAQ